MWASILDASVLIGVSFFSLVAPLFLFGSCGEGREGGIWDLGFVC